MLSVKVDPPHHAVGKADGMAPQRLSCQSESGKMRQLRKIPTLDILPIPPYIGC